MPIFVSTVIRTSIDEVWRATQEPQEHQRWDLRFSEISYLPRPSDDAPQQFLYRTRIGLGLEIGGGGESVGERSADDGSRTSILRFWSDDPKSLIQEGSGFWKYVPEGDGVRFFTVYDYKARFGVAGRVFDRVFFRPLMAWATAWSFDRLRLWLEEGVRPEDARRFAIVQVLSRLTLAAIWFYQGLVPKLLVRESGELVIAAAVVGQRLAAPLITASGVAEMVMAIALAVFGRSRALLYASSLIVAGLTLRAIVASPAIATSAFNAVTLTVSMIILGVIASQTIPLAPSAFRTKWSAWRRT
jgi:hypothetical protein